MADLRLVVLGCLMIVAFGQGKSGDVLYNCLFSPNCPIASIDDVKALASDLKRAARWENGALGSLLGCIRTIELTNMNKYSHRGTGCYDDHMVEKKGCEVACNVVKKTIENCKKPYVKC